MKAICLQNYDRVCNVPYCICYFAMNLAKAVFSGKITLFCGKLIKKRRKGKQYKGFSGKDDQKLIISTVDDFQGDERDIIIVSMVRNPKDHRFNAEFVKQYERINVAFSRARKLLIIVGAKKFLSEQTIELPDLSGNHALDKHNFPVYREIIDTINYRGRLLTANDIIGG